MNSPALMRSVARVIAGDGQDTGVLPESLPGTITHAMVETDTGVAYVLVLPALGAGAE